MEPKDTIKKATKFLEDVAAQVHGWGDYWKPDYDPIFADDGKIVGEEFNNEIECRGVDFGDEENDTAHIRLDGIDEDMAKGICNLYNHAWGLIDDLLTIIEEQQQRLDEHEPIKVFEKPTHELLTDRYGDPKFGLYRGDSIKDFWR